MNRKFKSRYSSLAHPFMVIVLTCLTLVNNGYAAEHTFKLGDGRFVQLTLPEGWTYCTEGMGDSQIILYYGTPGLSMIAAGHQGFDAIRINTYPSDKTTFSEADKNEFFKIEGIPNIKDTARLVEQDNSLAVFCELNQMWRITGTRLIDSYKVFVDEYIRGVLLEGENPDDYFQTRCTDYLTVLGSVRVFTDPTQVQKQPVIELRSSAGFQIFETILFFTFSNLKWIALVLILLIIGLVNMIKKKLKNRKRESIK